LRANINFKEVIPEIITAAANARKMLAQSKPYDKNPTQKEEEKLVYSEGDIKRMNYKWLD
jgi:hypothetical protein